MIRYAARSVPWALVLISCAIVVGLMSLVARWPWIMWPLQGTAVGVIAGAVAWSMDERSAGIVDTLPRALWWRTTARASVVPLLLAVWTGCLLAARDRLPDHFWLFVAQGAVAAGGALSFTIGRRRSGTPEPGRAFAALVIPTATALAIARPLARWFPVFPVWPDDNWAGSRVVWAVVAVVAFLAGITHLWQWTRQSKALIR